jgi:hypothetical protein
MAAGHVKTFRIPQIDRRQPPSAVPLIAAVWQTNPGKIFENPVNFST